MTEEGDQVGPLPEFPPATHIAWARDQLFALCAGSCTKRCGAARPSRQLSQSLLRCEIGGRWVRRTKTRVALSVDLQETFQTGQLVVKRKCKGYYKRNVRHMVLLSGTDTLIMASGKPTTSGCSGQYVLRTLAPPKPKSLHECMSEPHKVDSRHFAMFNSSTDDLMVFSTGDFEAPSRVFHVKAGTRFKFGCGFVLFCDPVDGHLDFFRAHRQPLKGRLMTEEEDQVGPLPEFPPATHIAWTRGTLQFNSSTEELMVFSTGDFEAPSRVSHVKAGTRFKFGPLVVASASSFQISCYVQTSICRGPDALRGIFIGARSIIEWVLAHEWIDTGMKEIPNKKLIIHTPIDQVSSLYSLEVDTNNNDGHALIRGHLTDGKGCSRIDVEELGTANESDTDYDEDHGDVVEAGTEGAGTGRRLCGWVEKSLVCGV
ncbi:hypothetical protein Pelo_18183 [Pelomyxa schiedti]|nr:hypothetical protein Pelo_18183 [Pelomyxa schiedti]